MKAPQLVVLEFDGWLSKQLRDLAADRKWLLKEARQAGAAKGLLSDGRPTVLFILIDPHKTPPDGLKRIAEIHLAHPDVAVVAVSDAKMPEDDRAIWVATALDLGARFVLFPPLTRTVLEDLASGLLNLRDSTKAGIQPHDSDVIDLAANEGIGVTAEPPLPVLDPGPAVPVAATALRFARLAAWKRPAGCPGCRGQGPAFRAEPVNWSAPQPP